MQKGFSPFAWALGLFCLPSALFPLAWFLTPHFDGNPALSAAQSTYYAVAFWIYPLVLLIVSLLLYRLHQRAPKAAWGLLALGFALFYYYAVSLTRVLV